LIVSKKYPELLREIQGALHQMERDGTMTTLKKKWDINA
jgi:ABC-type amino acid transport substrate-binding protein